MSCYKMKRFFDPRIKCRGSLVVEASLVLPVVLGVLVFLIFAGFYVHDRCIVAACSEETAVWLAHEKAVNGEKARLDASSVSGQFSADKELFLDPVYSGAVGNDVTVNAEALAPGPSGIVRQAFSGGIWQCRVEAKASVLCAEDTIRKTRVLLEWKDEITE